MGSAGNLPALVGNVPTGTAKSILTQEAVRIHPNRSSLPSGW